MPTNDQDQDKDKDQGQEQGQDARKQQQRIFIILGLIAALGYAVMATGMIRGQDGTPAPLPGGQVVQAWFNGLTAVDPSTITATYSSGRAFLWRPGWNFSLDAGERVILTIPATTSRWTQTRTLGLRLRPGADGSTPRARIVYVLQDPRDPASTSDLAPKLLGDANALVLPRKPAGKDDNPGAGLAARLRPAGGSSGASSPPEDLAQGKMALLLPAATVTITSQGDSPQIVEIF